jgi:hypothetical protein
MKKCVVCENEIINGIERLTTLNENNEIIHIHIECEKEFKNNREMYEK